MTAYRLDTAAAIRALEDAGVDQRQAAAIVRLHAAADADIATKTDLELARKALETDIRELRTELKTDIAEVKTDMGELRTELKTDIAEVKTDMGELRTEFKSLLQRIDTNHDLLHQQLETGLANAATAIADANAALQRRITALMGALVAVAALVLAGLAVF